MCLAASLTLLFKASFSTDSSTSATQIVINYDGVDNGDIYV